MIYLSVEVPPSVWLFVYTCTCTDKVKLDVDALDDFIQKPLMCLLCTINLKPLGVSKQSVASIAVLLLGKMTSCFVNCKDSNTCILMGNFRYCRILSKWIIAGCLVTKVLSWISCGNFIWQTKRYIFESDKL